MIFFNPQEQGESMDQRRPRRAQHSFLILFLLCFVSLFDFGCTSGVFKVQRRYSGRAHTIVDLRAHDVRRHGRILSGAVNFPLEGIGLPTGSGLYYTKIGIGTPSNSYYVQVDTGSNILWLNCEFCKSCPHTSSIGIDIKPYDLQRSSSGRLVTCKESFCSSTYGGDIPGCVQDEACEYNVLYDDGSSTAGYFVTDYVQYNQVYGNHQTTANTRVLFGCGPRHSSLLGSLVDAVDGILGLGQSNSSMLSQLASAGKVRKIFSHCLDTVEGGGIFAIGNVVQPKVKSTPLVPDMVRDCAARSVSQCCSFCPRSRRPHYYVILKKIQVGGTFLKVPTDVFETGDKKGTILDSGTTLAYLPVQVFKPLMNAIFSYQPSLSFESIQDFLCFKFSGRVDDGFPTISFHFENSVELPLYPHNYFFNNGKDIWCTCFQNSALQSKDGQDLILLGDMVLSNKLVIYDLENQVVGWTDYNCSSSIQIDDDKTAQIYTINAQNPTVSAQNPTVDAHNLSTAARSSEIGRLFAFLLFACFMFNLLQ